MNDTPSRVQRFTSVCGDTTVRFADGIHITPALGKESGASMGAYTAEFRAEASADLPAPYAEVWVVLSGAIRVGAGTDSVTVRTGEFVHVPEQAPGRVEAIEDTTMVCVSVPAH